MTIGDVRAGQLDGTRDWTLKSITDLHGDVWAFQPGPGLSGVGKGWDGAPALP